MANSHSNWNLALGGLVKRIQTQFFPSHCSWNRPGASVPSSINPACLMCLSFTKKTKLGSPETHRHNINKKNTFTFPTVHTFTRTLHLCYINQHVVSILTTMHICSTACWLLTTLLAVFKYSTAYNCLPGVKCLACSCYGYGRYNLRLPKQQTHTLWCHEGVMYIQYTYTVCSLQGRRYKKEGARGKSKEKEITTVEAFPKLLTLCISFPKIMVLHYSPKDECKYFLTDFFYFFIFTERLLTKVILICQKLNWLMYALWFLRIYFTNTRYYQVFWQNISLWYTFLFNNANFRYCQQFTTFTTGRQRVEANRPHVKHIPNLQLQCRM